MQTHRPLPSQNNTYSLFLGLFVNKKRRPRGLALLAGESNAAGRRVCLSSFFLGKTQKGHGLRIYQQPRDSSLNLDHG
jgi:hypothetical protein